jgi:hypothetical protein
MTLRLVILWMFLGVVAAFGLYMVKFRVQALKIEVAAAETQLREEKKNLHVLTAEWTYLNRPERLRALSAKYLDIKPVQGSQLADIAALPNSAVPHAAQPAAVVEPPSPPAARLVRGMTLASGAIHGR